MIEEIKYFILGLIQGLTEFFPVSSSGHLELYSHISNIAQEEPLLLFITVHLATALSTIIVYRDRIKKILLGITSHNNKKDISFVFKLIISSFPTIFIYILFSNHIDSLFKNSSFLVCIMLICTGLMLIMTQFFKKSNHAINYVDAILMGCAQALAIIPGISRSGATISTALFLKVNRKNAAEFSFLMALAPIIGGAIMKISEVIVSESIYDINITALIIAFIAAFISGLIACKYMIFIVQKNNLKYFGYYCIIISVCFLFLYMETYRWLFFAILCVNVLLIYLRKTLRK